jgi:hypothetical protein
MRNVFTYIKKRLHLIKVMAIHLAKKKKKKLRKENLGPNPDL